MRTTSDKNLEAIALCLKAPPKFQPHIKKDGLVNRAYSLKKQRIYTRRSQFGLVIYPDDQGMGPY